MAAADVETAPPAETPGLPDYLLDPNATLKDDKAKWRYGRAPDYSKTREVYENSKLPCIPSSSSLCNSYQTNH